MREIERIDWDGIRYSEPKHEPIKPAEPTDIEPGLRFLLCEDAVKEADRYTNIMSSDGWRRGSSDGPASHFRVCGDRVYPLLHRADRFLDGLITRALEHVQANPKTAPAWYKSIFTGISNGHPEWIRERCEQILGRGAPEEPQLHAAAAFDETSIEPPF